MLTQIIIGLVTLGTGIQVHSYPSTGALAYNADSLTVSKLKYTARGSNLDTERGPEYQTKAHNRGSLQDSHKKSELEVREGISTISRRNENKPKGKSPKENLNNKAKRIGQYDFQEAHKSSAESYVRGIVTEFIKKESKNSLSKLPNAWSYMDNYLAIIQEVLKDQQEKKSINIIVSEYFDFQQATAQKEIIANLIKFFFQHVNQIKPGQDKSIRVPHFNIELGTSLDFASQATRIEKIRAESSLIKSTITRNKGFYNLEKNLTDTESKLSIIQNIFDMLSKSRNIFTLDQIVKNYSNSPYDEVKDFVKFVKTNYESQSSSTSALSKMNSILEAFSSATSKISREMKQLSYRVNYQSSFNSLILESSQLYSDSQETLSKFSSKYTQSNKETIKSLSSQISTTASTGTVSHQTTSPTKNSKDFASNQEETKKNQLETTNKENQNVATTNSSFNISLEAKKTTKTKDKDGRSSQDTPIKNSSQETQGGSHSEKTQSSRSQSVTQSNPNKHLSKEADKIEEVMVDTTQESHTKSKTSQVVESKSTNTSNSDKSFQSQDTSTSNIDKLSQSQGASTSNLNKLSQSQDKITKKSFELSQDQDISASSHHSRGEILGSSSNIKISKSNTDTQSIQKNSKAQVKGPHQTALSLEPKGSLTSTNSYLSSSQSLSQAAVTNQEQKKGESDSQSTDQGVSKVKFTGKLTKVQEQSELKSRNNSNGLTDSVSGSNPKESQGQTRNSLTSSIYGDSYEETKKGKRTSIYHENGQRPTAIGDEIGSQQGDHQQIQTQSGQQNNHQGQAKYKHHVSHQTDDEHHLRKPMQGESYEQYVERYYKHIKDTRGVEAANKLRESNKAKIEEYSHMSEAQLQKLREQRQKEEDDWLKERQQDQKRSNINRQDSHQGQTQSQTQGNQGEKSDTVQHQSDKGSSRLESSSTSKTGNYQRSKRELHGKSTTQSDQSHQVGQQPIEIASTSQLQTQSQADFNSNSQSTGSLKVNSGNNGSSSLASAKSIDHKTGISQSSSNLNTRGSESTGSSDSQFRSPDRSGAQPQIAITSSSDSQSQAHQQNQSLKVAETKLDSQSAQSSGSPKGSTSVTQSQLSASHISQASSVSQQQGTKFATGSDLRSTSEVDTGAISQSKMMRSATDSQSSPFQSATVYNKPLAQVPDQSIIIRQPPPPQQLQTVAGGISSMSGDSQSSDSQLDVGLGEGSSSDTLASTDSDSLSSHSSKPKESSSNINNAFSSSFSNGEIGGSGKSQDGDSGLGGSSYSRFTQNYESSGSYRTTNSFQGPGDNNNQQMSYESSFRSSMNNQFEIFSNNKPPFNF